MPYDEKAFLVALSRHHADADARFAPLIAALRRHGVQADDHAWDTGGGVMCLSIDLPPVRTTLGSEHRPYILFSDLAQNYFCTGLYLDASGRGAQLDPPFDVTDAAIGDEWTPDLAERTASWFAAVFATLAPWASGLTYEGERRTLSAIREGYEEVTAVYDDEDIPAPEGTGVTVW